MARTHEIIGGYGAGMRPAFPPVAYPPLTYDDLLTRLGPTGTDPVLLAATFGRSFFSACGVFQRDLTGWTAAAIDGALAFVHHDDATARIDALIGVMGPRADEEDRAAYLAEAREVLGNTARIAVLLYHECAPSLDPTGDVEQV